MLQSLGEPIPFVASILLAAHVLRIGYGGLVPLLDRSGRSVNGPVITRKLVRPVEDAPPVHHQVVGNSGVPEALRRGLDQAGAEELMPFNVEWLNDLVRQNH